MPSEVALAGKEAIRRWKRKMASRAYQARARVEKKKMETSLESALSELAQLRKKLADLRTAYGKLELEKMALETTLYFLGHEDTVLSLMEGPTLDALASRCLDVKKEEV